MALAKAGAPLLRADKKKSGAPAYAGTMEVEVIKAEEITTDLLNQAAAVTLRHGGYAYALPRSRIPRAVPAAATLRF